MHKFEHSRLRVPVSQVPRSRIPTPYYFKVLSFVLGSKVSVVLRHSPLLPKILKWITNSEMVIFRKSFAIQI
jgi:hypothetical protein